MKATLNALEKRAVDDLLARDRTRRKADLIASHRVRERHRLASTLRKLTGRTEELG